MNAIGAIEEDTLPDTVLMESDGRTLRTYMLLWKPNGNSHILINIPRDPSRKHAKNSKQGFAGISLDNTMKLRNPRLDRDGNAT